ncbi:MAG: flagellar hook-length control protein FliK [Phycisphaeraceae bacterium]|nr:flagellar hook-length control protein FliK [Phycisphaeraceae bacterium]
MVTQAAQAVRSTTSQTRAPAQKPASPDRSQPRRAEEPPHAQFERGLHAALRSRDGRVSLRLSPAALGVVHVALRVQADRVSATLRAASNEARGLLESSLDHLRAALEARGLNVERLDVGVDGGAGEREASDRGAEDRPETTGGAGPTVRSADGASDAMELAPDAWTRLGEAYAELRLVGGSLRVDALA